MCGVLNFFGYQLPMIAAWYPEKYENTKLFKKDLALPALFDWTFLLCLTFAAGFPADSHIYVSYLRVIGELFLFYKIVAIYPFESFGGGRVYRWNRWVYGIMAIASIGVIFLL